MRVVTLTALAALVQRTRVVTLTASSSFVNLVSEGGRKRLMTLIASHSSVDLFNKTVRATNLVRRPSLKRGRVVK